MIVVMMIRVDGDDDDVQEGNCVFLVSAFPADVVCVCVCVCVCVRACVRACVRTCACGTHIMFNT